MNNRKVLIVLLLGLILISWIDNIPNNDRRVEYEEIEIKYEVPNVQHSVVTLDSIEQYLRKYKVRHVDIVLAQVKLESGYLTSGLYKSNNNPFGMKRAGSRPTTSSGVKNGFAYYDSVEMAVLDYALMQAAYYKNLNREQYLAKLDKVYCNEDSKYSSKIKKLLK